MIKTFLCGDQKRKCVKSQQNDESDQNDEEFFVFSSKWIWEPNILSRRCIFNLKKPVW